MVSFIRKPYLYFLIITILILVIGVSNENSIIDLNIHDNYYVIPNSILTYYISPIFLIFGLCYYIIYKLELKLTDKITYLHVIISISSLFLYFIMDLYETFFQSNKLVVFDDNKLKNQVLVILFFINIIAQPLFFIHMISAFFKEKINKNC